MISSKTYYCPNCQHESQHSTNHYGEIYCHCNLCGSSPLYCKGQSLGTPDRQATIHFYDFDLTKDRTQYNELCKKLKNKFKVLTEPKTFSYMKKHDGKVINLYKVSQFQHQYVSDIGRVHDWFEAVFPNKDIVAGYYLIHKEANNHDNNS